MIDLGAQHTGIGVWRADTIELGAIPIGGEHFSRDVLWRID